MPQYITIYDTDANASTICIEEGASTFAGTASHCEVQLGGANVEPIQCMFSCIGGELKIQDWNTNGKTSLNGEPLLDESPFAPGDEVSIGDNLITVGSAAELAAAVDDIADSEKPAASADSPSEPEAAAEVTQSESASKGDGLEQELEKLRSSNSELEAEFSSFGDTTDNVDSYFDDPFADSDTELLRSEIENLQMELVDRDQQLIMLRQQVESGEGSGGDMEETARLVARMEELLDELQNADDRIHSFEELLRTSDEATQAEQEERRQLENWVEQIEQRVTAREEESKAEVERLNQRIRKFIAQQKHNEQVLEKALQQRGNGSAGSGYSDDLVQSLQQQVAELQESWRQSQEDNERLAQAASVAAASGEDGATVADLQQKLMQLEMDTARERAQVARERAELTKVQTELEQQYKTPAASSDAEIRLKAMREHLRELHEEEEIVREVKRQQSLGGRIASLFTRIESR